MLEKGTSGLMSGDGKRDDRLAASTRARPRLYRIALKWGDPPSPWKTHLVQTNQAPSIGFFLCVLCASPVNQGFLYALSSTPGLIFTSATVSSKRALPPWRVTVLNGTLTPETSR